MSEIDSIILNGVEYEIAGSGGSYTSYTITNNLTNVSNSNGATTIREGRSYSATLSLATGATLSSVTITMGGVDITASSWNASTMAISIASVTNNIVITASAVVVIERTITWSGSGSDKDADLIFDLSEYDLYFELPYVEGFSGLSADAVSGGNAVAIGVGLYSDAECTQFLGRYNITTGEIVTSWTWNTAPSLLFDTNTMIAPCGEYYAKIRVSNVRGAFNNNGDCSNYLNTYGTTVTLVSHTEPEPEPEPEPSNAETTENDLLQVYAVRSLSTSTAEASTYAGIIEEVKNAWMLEYGGSLNKIPLIIHTDQHSEMGDATSKTMWDTIDGMVSWYDISKVINLGDTTNSYENFDNPLLGDTSLDNYLEATKNVPFSKRIEVFGNHDCMQIRGGALTYIPQYPSYLNPYFKNVMARRTSDNGYHVTYDPYFNVKYIVYSPYDYEDASHYNLVSSAQYEFLIEEMTKNDGYDIIMCGHTDPSVWGENIGTLVTARYNKTAGTITDKMSVTHTYDFTNCENRLLLSLHGHSHSDGYNYNSGALSQCFANYYADTRPIYFVIIDRENDQIKAWKVMNTPAYETYTRSFAETT